MLITAFQSLQPALSALTSHLVLAATQGRVIEIYGPEASGKTTLLFMPLQKLKNGGVCAFIDAEHALDIITLVTWVSTLTNS